MVDLKIAACIGPQRAFRGLLLMIVPLLLAHAADASKVLMFAMTGMRSHHMNLVKVASELQARGHEVSTLISSYDEVAQNVIATRGLSGLETIAFSGPPGLGTERWAARLSPDPLEVRKDAREARICRGQS